MVMPVASGTIASIELRAAVPGHAEQTRALAKSDCPTTAASACGSDGEITQLVAVKHAQKNISVSAITRAAKGAYHASWSSEERGAPMFLCIARCADEQPSGDPEASEAKVAKSEDAQKNDAKVSKSEDAQKIDVKVTTSRGTRSGRLSITPSHGAAVRAELQVDTITCGRDGRPVRKSAGCRVGRLDELLKVYPRAECDELRECP